MAHSRRKIIAAAIMVASIAAGCSKANKAVEYTGGHFGPPVGHNRQDTAGGSITIDVSLADSAIIVNPTVAPATETVMAKFANLGSQPEKVYGFLPGTQATYYLYVEPSLNPTTHTVAFRIKQVLANGDSSNFLTGGLTDCADHHSNPHAYVGFKKCGAGSPDALGGSAGPPTKGNPNAIHRSAMFSNPFFARLFRGITALIQAGDTTYDLTDPAWIACTDGCCTVNAS